MRQIISLLLMAGVVASSNAASPGSTEQQAGYDAQRGKALWEQKYIVSGQPRSCTTCHTNDPRQTGKHARTGKPIKPMAHSVHPERFTSQKKIEKWFKRNCKWTLGRLCTEQEKGDVLKYLNSL